MENNLRYIQVPSDVLDEIQLRRFLDKLVERLINSPTNEEFKAITSSIPKKVNFGSPLDENLTLPETIKSINNLISKLRLSGVII